MGKSEQIDSLTGVRGVAAIWVALFHADGYLVALDLPAPFAALLRSGWLAVDMFFVLSGFIMCHVHLNDFRESVASPASRFLKLRLSRIYPAHLAMVLLSFPLLLAMIWSGRGLSEGVASNYNLRTFLHAVTLTNGAGIPGASGWNLQSWSVGSEWFAYLLFPLVAGSLGRVKSTAVAVAALIGILLITTGLACAINDGRQYMLPAAYTLVRVLSEFLVGCCTYLIYRGAVSSSAGKFLSYTGFGGAMVLGCLDPGARFGGLFILSFAALILGLSSSTTTLARWLGSRPMVYLGKISYSVYLTHLMLAAVVRQAAAYANNAGFHITPFWLTLAFLLGSLLSGHMLFAMVEEPSRKWLRKKWIGNPRVSA